jgi:glycine betaine/proline transport system permease protein
MNFSLPQISPGAFLAPAVDWLNKNFHPLFAAISTLIETILGAIETALLSVPSYVLIAVVVILAFFLVNVRVAVLAGVALGFCLLVGLWEASIQSIALVTVAVTISVLIAFPLGILRVTARSRRRYVPYWTSCRPCRPGFT